MLNQKRINLVLKRMADFGYDHFLITEPETIDYLIGYLNYPHERTYVMALSQEGDHRLFFNQLFYVDEDLGLPITWFSDADDSLALIASYLKDAKHVGVDKNMPARYLLPLMAETSATYEVGSVCVYLVRVVKDVH